MAQGSPPIERLREMVAERIRATSLRAVAREVGLSPTGLDRFIAGSTPYAKTRRKLHDWCFANRERPLAECTDPEYAAAIDLLLRSVPAEEREEAFAGLLATLRGLHSAHPDVCAEWLVRLVEGLPADEGEVFQR